MLEAHRATLAAQRRAHEEEVARLRATASMADMEQAMLKMQGEVERLKASNAEQLETERGKWEAQKEIYERRLEDFGVQFEKYQREEHTADNEEVQGHRETVAEMSEADLLV